MREAYCGWELQQATVSLIGPQCFAGGVITGIGADIIGSVVDLAKLVGKFVLADLHDLNVGRVHWTAFINPTAGPRLLIAKAAGNFFDDTLKQAADERDALIQELSKAFAEPGAFFDGMADQVIESYKKEWHEYQTHMQSQTLEGRFRAGMIFGKLLMVIIGVATGIYGAAKLGAKGITQLPKLAELAKRIKLRPGDVKPPSQALQTSAPATKSGVVSLASPTKTDAGVPALVAKSPAAEQYGVAFFGDSNLRYYNHNAATIGRDGKAFFFMPLADSAIVKNAGDAARYTGRAPSAEAAYLSGGEIYGLSFPTKGMAVSRPTAADAGGWPHFLEGGRTAVKLGDGPGTGYLVNPTREFVVPGGNPVPEGSALFKLGPNGDWIPIRKF